MKIFFILSFFIFLRFNSYGTEQQYAWFFRIEKNSVNFYSFNFVEINEFSTMVKSHSGKIFSPQDYPCVNLRCSNDGDNHVFFLDRYKKDFEVYLVPLSIKDLQNMQKYYIQSSGRPYMNGVSNSDTDSLRDVLTYMAVKKRAVPGTETKFPREIELVALYKKEYPLFPAWKAAGIVVGGIIFIGVCVAGALIYKKYQSSKKKNSPKQVVKTLQQKKVNA